MSKAAKGNDDFELSADELAKQEGRPKPTLVEQDEQPVDPGDPYRVPLEADFFLPGETEDSEAIAIDFLTDDELTLIGNRLIYKHSTFSHLAQAKIAFLWKRTGGKKSGQLKFGQCQRPTGLLAYYSALDFVIWLGADHCRETMFTNRQVEALVFHELKHAGYKETESGERTWSVDGHDWEGFVDEIRIYGDWMPDISKVREAFQMHLFERGE